ncbi:MAG: OmpA family protein [Vicinamibacteria bacterium]
MVTTSKIMLPVLLGLAILTLGGCRKGAAPLSTMIPGSAGFDPAAAAKNLSESDFEGGAAPLGVAFDASGQPLYGGSSLGTVYFEYDSYELNDEAIRALSATAQSLRSGAGGRVLVRGHCDDRGAGEYNLALGEKRATAARDFLVSHGVDQMRIAVVSLGEEQPVCRESHEECWWRNRRDDFVAQ